MYVFHRVAEKIKEHNVMRLTCLRKHLVAFNCYYSTIQHTFISILYRNQHMQTFPHCIVWSHLIYMYFSFSLSSWFQVKSGWLLSFWASWHHSRKSPQCATLPLWSCRHSPGVLSRMFSILKQQNTRLLLHLDVITGFSLTYLYMSLSEKTLFLY